MSYYEQLVVSDLLSLIIDIVGSHWIIIGAAVTILSLGFEPFLQAIVSYSGKMGDLDSIHSSIGRCMRLDVGTYTSDGDLLISQEFSPQHMVDTLPEFSSSPDFGICATVYDGFSNSTPTKSQQVSFSCTTGNCTWPLFGSLAVCSSCNDVSSHVTRSRGNGVWNSTITAANQDITQVQAGNFTCFELPYLNICNYDGYTSSYMSANMTANRTAQTQQTVSFQNSTSSIVTFGFLQAAGSYFANSTAWEETPIIATECNLHFCVNIYESMVESGVIAERIVGSWSERAPDSWGSTTLSPQDVQSWNQRINSTLAPGFDITRTDLQMVIPKDEAAQIPQLPPNTALSFNVSQAAIVSTTLWIVGEFKGSAGLSGSVDELAYPLIGDQATMQPAISTVLAQSGNLSAMFDSVALSMSTWMRDISIDRTPQLGTTSQWVIYVRVRWWYFLLPAAVLVFGCIFTILSIIESYRLHVPPWKAGSLPILAHGLTPDVCERLRDADGMGQINDEAHEIKVRLRNMGSGLGLQVQH